jgi:hypothetical protein
LDGDRPNRDFEDLGPGDEADLMRDSSRTWSRELLFSFGEDIVLLLVVASSVVLATPNILWGHVASQPAPRLWRRSRILRFLVLGDCRRVGNAGAPGTLRLGLSCESEWWTARRHEALRGLMRFPMTVVTRAQRKRSAGPGHLA